MQVNMQKENVMGFHQNQNDKQMGKKRIKRSKRKFFSWSRESVMDSLYAFRFCEIGISCITASELVNKWKASKKKCGDSEALIQFEKHKDEMYVYVIHLMKKKNSIPKNRSKFFTDLNGKRYKSFKE